MTAARIGYGSAFSLDDGSGDNLVRIAEIDNITPPAAKAATEDATNLDSPNGYMEFIPGMIDPGEFKFDMNFLPGSASETLIVGALGQTRNAKIVFPGGQQWTFLLMITDYAPAAPTAKKMTASVSGKVSGLITRA